MSTRLTASTILLVVLLALSGCESSSTEPQEPIQYPNQEETTVAPSEPTVQYSNEHIQYHSVELPDTGGLRI